MQVEEDAATTTAQQQTRLLLESHNSITAALEQVAAHGELLVLCPSPFTKAQLAAQSSHLLAPFMTD